MIEQLGYCTNVHAGAGLAETRANLERHALGVKRRFSPDAPMGVGLWLSAQAAREMLALNQVAAWRDWLGEVGLVPFTFNGFPFGDFHQRVVKHDVYLPTWADRARLDYTRDLVTIIDGLLPAGMEGSISTLPIAWGDPDPEPGMKEEAAVNLRRAAECMAELEKRTGRVVYLCLEPEPGCIFTSSADLVEYFEEYVLAGSDEEPLRRHLRVCHDVCHQAVMFEDQAEALALYRSAGIRIGKVQVSSAVRLPLNRLPPSQHEAAIAQLAAFDETRYLHQTTVRHIPGVVPDATPVLHEDLSSALGAIRDAEFPVSELRVHFHVPIYLERFGLLETTRWAIRDCLQAVKAYGDTTHFEVETYAWGVLPPELRVPELADGIAREMQWSLDTLTSEWRV
jgi:hypothetical protein